ncbi:DUF5693 family protein [Marinitoga sp. 38H-ov]|uniref:DUF5693 family protein n=1 Tax=Marinitoga sp. 38H-ov TaxID=1755814 RepID=UPI0013EC974A|nr:DUF5693 family protein [Marinitoga sp. 38H-ov]KAF2955671.1 hypothetical protein AS160_00740 [Marinitoga sp. 38H-ov]
MKKYSNIVFLITIFFSISIFIYISYNDYNYLKRGYHIIDNNLLEKQSTMIENKLIEYYSYKDYVLISENSTSLTIEEFKAFLSEHDNVLIAEFSDFGYLFDKYKVNLNNNELYKIRYVHYIKPKEMDKYNIEQIEQRFWRAFNERRLNIFYIPNHEKRDLIIEGIKKRMKNYNKDIPILPKHNKIIPIFSSILSSIYIGTFIPLLSIIYLLSFFFLNGWSYVFLAIIFSFISWIKWKKDKKQNIFKFVLLNILFGILIYGTGYNYLLIYKISVIRGVKLLLIILPFVLFLVQIKKFKLNKKDIIFSTIILLIFGAYYILRSGNFGFSSMYERNIRDFLEKTLIARPRFKEFFAYIFIFTKPPTKFFSIFWNIGQSILFVSILDTFLHFQTQIYLGVLRTLYAFLLSYVIIRFIKYITFISTEVLYGKKHFRI